MLGLGITIAVVKTAEDNNVPLPASYSSSAYNEGYQK